MVEANVVAVIHRQPRRALDSAHLELLLSAVSIAAAAQDDERDVLPLTMPSGSVVLGCIHEYAHSVRIKESNMCHLAHRRRRCR